MQKAIYAGLMVATFCLGWHTSQAANTDRGRQIYTARCGGCHSILENGAGPRHQGLFGCRAGTQPGFAYSEALRKSNIVWDEHTLDRWLAKPSSFVPGNKMIVQLSNDDADRQNVIAYLRETTRGPGDCISPDE